MKNANLLLLLSVIFMASCAPTYYTPKTINVPLLETKNDIQISGHTDTERTLNLQGAYAVSDHIGITMDLFNYNNEVENGNDNTSNSRGKYTYQSAELGLGYFTKLNDLLHFEIYGIGALGKLSKFSNARPTEYYEPARGSISSNYTLLGAQPSLGIKWKYVELAYSLRFLRVDYYNTSGNFTWNGNSEINYLNQLDYQNVVEQGFTLRAGLEKLKLQLQLVKSDEVGLRQIDLDSDSRRGPLEGATASIGLTYNFNVKDN